MLNERSWKQKHTDHMIPLRWNSRTSKAKQANRNQKSGSLCLRNYLRVLYKVMRFCLYLEPDLVQIKNSLSRTIKICSFYSIKIESQAKIDTKHLVETDVSRSGTGQTQGSLEYLATPENKEMLSKQKDGAGKCHGTQKPTWKSLMTETEAICCINTRNTISVIYGILVLSQFIFSNCHFIFTHALVRSIFLGLRHTGTFVVVLNWFPV